MRINYNERIKFGRFKGMDTKDLVHAPKSIFNSFASYLHWTIKTDIQVDDTTIKRVNERIRCERSGENIKYSKPKPPIDLGPHFLSQDDAYGM